MKAWFQRTIVSVVKPFAKRYAIGFVQKEGDILEQKVLYLYDTEGPKGIDRAFDSTQMRLIELAMRIPFAPDWLKKSIVGIVQEEGDDLQANVKKVAVKGGHLAIQKAFDAAQEAIVARIQEL